MLELITIVDRLIAALRSGVNVMLVVALGLAALAWAVRTRRISPFSGVSRFVRANIDPRLASMESRVLRMGGTSASVPWWALLALFVGAVGVIFVLGFVRDTIVGVYYASRRGPTGYLGLALSWTLSVLQLALLVRVISSWVGGQFTSIVQLSVRMTEWFLGPLRRLLPPLGMMDLSPLVAWLIIGLLQSVVLPLR